MRRKAAARAALTLLRDVVWCNVKPLVIKWRLIEALTHMSTLNSAYRLTPCEDVVKVNSVVSSFYAQKCYELLENHSNKNTSLNHLPTLSTQVLVALRRKFATEQRRSSVLITIIISNVSLTGSELMETGARALAAVVFTSWWLSCGPLPHPPHPLYPTQTRKN